MEIKIYWGPGDGTGGEKEVRGETSSVDREYVMEKSFEKLRRRNEREKERDGTWENSRWDKVGKSLWECSLL